MTRILLTGLAATLLYAAPAIAQSPYTCGTGTLLDVELVTEVVGTGSTTITTVTRNTRGERREYEHTSPGQREVRSYLVTIQLDDMRYVAESSAAAPWNFNPLRLVINDPIGVCVDRHRLIVKRPDGKNYKADIVRAVRDGKSDQESGASSDRPGARPNAPSSQVSRHIAERGGHRLGSQGACITGMVHTPCSAPGPSIAIDVFRPRR